MNKTKSRACRWTRPVVLLGSVIAGGCLDQTSPHELDPSQDAGVGQSARAGEDFVDEKARTGLPGSSGASTGAITHGPILSQVNTASVGVWLRTNQSAAVSLRWANNAKFANSRVTATKTTLLKSDFTAKLFIEGLAPDTTYWYRVELDGVLQPGVWQIRTAPASSTASFTMAVLSDFDAVEAPVLAAVNALNPNLVVFEGDLDHRNSGLGKGKVLLNSADALTSMRTMHKELRGSESPFGRDFKAIMIDRSGPQYPFLHVWDDHDYGANNADIGFARRPEALQAFDEYFIRAGNQEADPNRGPWQLQSYGAADIFILDLRSERDPNGAPNGVGAVPAAACKFMHGNESHTKTILGPQQKQWFKDQLLASTRRWKIIISTVPFNPGCKAYDAWGAFPDERAEVVNFIKQNGITGVIFVTGDIHSGGGIDDGTNSSFTELSVPFANVRDTFVDTWIHGSDATCEQGNTCGNWSEGLLCGAPAGPGGPGFGYLEVSQSEVVLSVRGKLGGIRKRITIR